VRQTSRPVPRDPPFAVYAVVKILVVGSRRAQVAQSRRLRTGRKRCESEYVEPEREADRIQEVHRIAVADGTLPRFDPKERTSAQTALTGLKITALKITSAIEDNRTVHFSVRGRCADGTIFV
jgi:hypothetical protein